MIAFADGARSATSTVEGKPQSRKLAVDDRAVVRHVQRVAQTRNTGKLSCRNSQTRARRLFDQFSRRVSLAAVHTRARNHHDRRRLTERCSRRQSCIRNVLHATVFIANQPDHFELDCIAKTRMMTGAMAHHAAHVQQVKLIAALAATAGTSPTNPFKARRRPSTPSNRSPGLIFASRPVGSSSML